MQISYPAIKHITTSKSTIPTVPKSVYTLAMSFRRRIVPNENKAALSFQQGKNFFGPKLASPVFHPTVFFLSIYHPKDRFGHRPAAFRSQRIASGVLTNEDRHRKGFSWEAKGEWKGHQRICRGDCCWLLAMRGVDVCRTSIGWSDVRNEKDYLQR